MKRTLLVSMVVLCSTLMGCRSAYYAAWEKMGKQKRDLLQTKVKQVQEGQSAAAEQLKDALTRLQDLYGSQGTELEKMYRRLQDDYNRSQDRANTVRSRIKQMDQVARDLFVEWEKEANSITTATLRQNSMDQLRTTRVRYDALYSATTRAEQRLEPVLTKFKDYVLYLKHNLNAQSLGALQGEATRIQTDITQLIGDMNASIQEADRFIQATK